MNKYIAGLALVALCACKTAKPVATTTEKTIEKTGSSNVIAGHYAVPRQFSTAYIKASVRYEDARNKQNVSAEIRIKKDETILVSVRVLGITMAKALITPREVKYYEKINGEYFEGDYAALTKFLGTDLDFQKVQNLLIGQAMDDLNATAFTTSTENNLYKLESRAGNVKQFFFEPAQFWLVGQRIEQPEKQRSMQVNYSNYVTAGAAVFPRSLLIDALQPKGKTTIEVDIQSIDVDRPLTFPYSVPGGYERIQIND